MKQTILVVDDELAIRSSLKNLLEDEGYNVVLAQSGEEALVQMQPEQEVQVDAALLDIWLPQMDGIEVLKSIKHIHPDLPVIMISGHGSIDTAVTATKHGAYHFIEKPFSEESLLITLGNALRQIKLQRENVKLKRDVQRTQNEIVGKSIAFKLMIEQIERSAASEAWVLIHGENGTGKEAVAHLIHNNSPRKNRPFVDVNCAAIPEELIESELFGHEKGSFTGATAKKVGKFDQADGGTLFLDEIGDMSLKTQAKILRVLQEQRFERVGGNKTVEVDVRVIAASNKKLEVEIASGNFREDLYYRLAVLPLEVPPLREREGDVEELALYYLDYFSKAQGHKRKSIHPKALQTLNAYGWPGNIRELRNIVERMTIMVSGDQIGVQDIPPAVLQAVGAAPLVAPQAIAVPGVAGSGPEAGSAPSVSETTEPVSVSMPVPETATAGALGEEPPDGSGLPAELVHFNGTYREAKDAFERSFLAAQLEKHGGNISKTAEAIKLERSNLHKKIKQLKIETG